jgi:hypothetical protein
VTAAHEFHHASQFAYDWLEDVWLLEGTATNMEETVYPAVDDNIFFLEDWSPFTRPGTPLDRGGFGDSEYGSWIFWRFLEEKGPGDRSSLIRRVWERAAAALPTDPDHYSLRAVYLVLRARGSHLADEFAAFGVANRRRDYLDGSLYPGTPTARRFRIGPNRPGTGRHVRRLKHLATQFFTFRPGRHVSSSAKLRVSVDVDVHGGRATLIVHYRDGTEAVRRFSYTRSGFGSRRVHFGRGFVRRVDLVLSNGSSRTRCWRDFREPPFFSCLGVPRDDRRIYSFRATLRDVAPATVPERWPGADGELDSAGACRDARRLMQLDPVQARPAERRSALETYVASRRSTSRPRYIRAACSISVALLALAAACGGDEFSASSPDAAELRVSQEFDEQIRLDPGRYRLVSWQRPCDGSCDSLDAPTDRCEQTFALEPNRPAAASIEVRASSGCRIAFG